MIKKIKTIQKINNFKNFKWPFGEEEFKNVNIVYGANGVGKTTLSNIFNLFSEHNDNHEELWAKIKNDEASYVELTTTNDMGREKRAKYENGDSRLQLPLYVFNDQFVVEHVYEGNRANVRPFSDAVSTKEQQLKNPEIQEIENKISSYNESQNILKQIRRELKKKFEQIQSRWSKNLNKNIPGTKSESFDIESGLEINKRVQKLEEELDLTLEKYKTANDSNLKPNLNEIRNLKFKRLDMDLEEIKKILEKEIQKTSSKKIRDKISSFSNAPKHSESWNGWLQDGLSLLKLAKHDKKQCPLCNTNLKETLDSVVGEYEDYFDKSYETLMNQIKKIINDFSEIPNVLSENELNGQKLKKHLKTYQALMQDQINEEEKEQSDNSFNVTHLKEKINSLKRIIEGKKSAVNTDISENIPENISVEIKKYNNQIGLYEKLKNELIKKLDQQTENLDAYKEQARELSKIVTLREFDKIDLDIERFWSDKNLDESFEGSLPELENIKKIAEVGSNREKFKKLTKLEEEIKREVNKLSTKRTKKIADLKDESKYLNDFLKHLGVFHFDVDINQDKEQDNITVQYEKSRTKDLDCSLSTSEKTCLAFAYFLSKLKYEVFDADGVEAKNIILVIDDPVSSLDENRLYRTACFIEKMCFDQQTKNTKFKQFFLFSHNLQFLKFISNILHIDNENREDYYLSSGNNSPRLKPLPAELQNYATLYFSKLKEVIKYNNGDDIDYAQARKFMPNHIRSIMETFLSFKFFELKEGSSNKKYRSPGLSKLIRIVDNNLYILSNFQDVEDVNGDTIVNKLNKIKRITDPQSHGNAQDITKFSFISEEELQQISKDAVNIIHFLDQLHYRRINQP
jgi:wobble nucleotide-excising tRNase